VLKDGAADVAVGDHGEDAHGAAGGVADQDIDRDLGPEVARETVRLLDGVGQSLGRATEKIG